MADGHANKSAIDRKETDMGKKLVAVTACTAGVAHTYMAAEGLRKAAERAGIEMHVETQGTTGIENRITPEMVSQAVAVIFAHDVAIADIGRFEGVPTVDVATVAAIKDADSLVERALAIGRDPSDGFKTSPAAPEKSKTAVEGETGPGFVALVRDSVLSGISYIIPVIIAGGMISAVATIAGQALGLQELLNDSTSWLSLFKSLGSGALGTLMVPILSAYMAFALADKPGLAPGFIGGLAATTIESGFLGGMLSGLLAGFLMRWMKEHIKGAGPARTFITFWVYPVIGSAIVGILVLFVAGPPIAYVNQLLVDFLENMQGTNALLLGAIIGAMVSFDLGGPVNKAAYAFCVGAMANGNLVPYAVFASVKMVSAFSCTAACTLRKDLFSDEERQVGSQTWMLGLAGITEGAIPFMMLNPVSVGGSFIAGSIVCGSIVAMTNVGLSVPGAGIFSLIALSGDFGALGNGAIWLGAALVGTVVSTACLILTRKRQLARQSA